MKTKYLKAIILLSAVILFCNSTEAQISFPEGNVLNLNTNNDFLYIETRILFNTGSYNADDYRWEKVSDSLDKRWLVGACFNGECRNDLEQNGSFIRDYGINDTTCFIAFHVETHEFNGASVIIYKVYNKKNEADSAILIFNITYTKLVGLEQVVKNDLVIYPNPASSTILLKSHFDLQNAEVRIFNRLGESVFDHLLKDKTIDVAKLNSGMYIVQLKMKDKFYTQKFIKL